MGFVLRTELLIVTFAALIAAASSGIPGPAGAILNSRIVRYVGRISYGIYLFHLFLYAGHARCWPGLAFHLWDRGPRCFIVMSAMSIGAAAVSWHFFEQPINRLKERLFVFPSMSVLHIKGVPGMCLNRKEDKGRTATLSLCTPCETSPTAKALPRSSRHQRAARRVRLNTDPQ